MPENGVIFSDGIQEDFLEFNSGAVAEISAADKKGNLVTKQIKKQSKWVNTHFTYQFLKRSTIKRTAGPLLPFVL